MPLPPPTPTSYLSFIYEPPRGAAGKESLHVTDNRCPSRAGSYSGCAGKRPRAGKGPWCLGEEKTGPCRQEKEQFSSGPTPLMAPPRAGL